MTERNTLLLSFLVLLLVAVWFGESRHDVESRSVQTQEDTAMDRHIEALPSAFSQPTARARVSTGNALVPTLRPQPSEDLDELVIPRAPFGKPFAEVRIELARRADAGDALAASDLYRGIFTCSWIKSQLDAAPNLLKSLIPDGRSIDELEPDERESVLRMIAHVQPAIDFSRANAAYCVGSDDALDDRTFHSAALKAARLGDEGAALCYLSTAIYSIDVNNPADSAAAAEYKENALALAEWGVTQGDWRMAYALEGLYAGTNSYSSLLAQPDPAKSYAYDKLLRLLPAVPSIQRAEETVPIDSINRAITIEEKAEADRWAMETYQRYFLDSSLRQSDYPVCDLR